MVVGGFNLCFVESSGDQEAQLDASDGWIKFGDCLGGVGDEVIWSLGLEDEKVVFVSVFGQANFGFLEWIGGGTDDLVNLTDN